MAENEPRRAGRKAVPDTLRASVVRDQRLVTMLTAEEKERLDAAVVKHKYATAADLVREALVNKLDRLDKRR